MKSGEKCATIYRNKQEVGVAMLSVVHTAGIYGIDGYTVTVECNAVNAIPHFDIVGLPDTSIKESKERIKAAVGNSGIEFPDMGLTVNLAPADKKKEGSSYDLAITIAILAASGVVSPDAKLDDCGFIGELSLSGDIRPVRGVLSMCLACSKEGKSEIFVPAENAPEASAIKEANIYPVKSLSQLLIHLNTRNKIEKCDFNKTLFTGFFDDTEFDFADVKGQHRAKAALEVAAVGSHNVLLIGPPGSGKSMLAKRLPSILPPLTLEEAIETTKIHSVAGILPANASIVTKRPFRSPHHTMSSMGLSGGGQIPMPGEISLCNNGVLFLDELPEFRREALEVLRQPMEDGAVTITRVNGKIRYPSKFMLVCAMNPCKCGYFGSTVRKCTCKDIDIKRYLARISGPLLDRIDIQIEMPALTYDELSSAPPAESSESVRKRVMEARAYANERNEVLGISSNSEMTAAHIRECCVLTPEAKKLLKAAFGKMGLSARGYDRIQRVARSVADLDKSETINDVHMAMAINFRSLDKKYWQYGKI